MIAYLGQVKKKRISEILKDPHLFEIIPLIYGLYQSYYLINERSGYDFLQKST